VQEVAENFNSNFNSGHNPTLNFVSVFVGGFLWEIFLQGGMSTRDPDITPGHIPSRTCSPRTIPPPFLHGIGHPP